MPMRQCYYYNALVTCTSRPFAVQQYTHIYSVFLFFIIGDDATLYLPYIVPFVPYIVLGS